MVQLRSDISIIKNVDLSGVISGSDVLCTEVYGYDSLDEYAEHRKEMQHNDFEEIPLCPETPIEWYVAYAVIGRYAKCKSFNDGIDITYRLVLRNVER